MVTILWSWSVIACAVKIESLRVVPYPIAGDVSRFSEEAPLAGLQLAPHVEADKQALADAVSSELKALMEEQRQARAVVVINNITDPSTSSQVTYQQLQNGVHTGASLVGSAVMESYLGKECTGALKLVETVFAGLFFVGWLDYSAPELVGLLTRIYLSYFLLRFLVSTYFSFVFLHPQSKFVLPGLIVPISGALAWVFVIRLSAGLKRNDRTLLSPLAYMVLSGLACSCLPLWKSQWLGQIGPLVICITMVSLGSRLQSQSAAVRGYLEATISTVGLLGCSTTLFPSAQIFYPDYFFSPFYAKLATPHFSFVMLVITTIAIIASAMLQTLREEQRKDAYDDNQLRQP